MSVKLKNKSEEVFSMRKLYVLAVYELNGSVEVIRTRSNSDLFDYHMTSGVQLEKMGYKPIKFIITTNREIHLKALLKARLMELRSYTEKSMELLQAQMGFVPDEVLATTQKMVEEHEETLMFSIGSLVSRLLRREVDITDELALACHYYRQKVLASV